MEQLKKLYRSLSATQRWSILIFGLLIIIGVSWFTHQQRESGFRPLFSSLSTEDASAIIVKLKEGGVDYRIGENGTSVMVPEARVAELRLELAGAGLPKTGRIGYEIFDKTNFGITDFAEHVNYRRAVEGELERSIVSIAEVEQARVHITFPKESVYLDAREPAKASVLVRLHPGASLSGQNVAAITHLVSSAVEGLVPTAVSLVDMNGNLLNRPRRAATGDSDLSGEALEYRQRVEHELQAKIGGTLESLLGPDKFRTAVSAECDMTAGEQSEEVFDPSKSVMVQSQRTEDAPGSTTIASGQPGTASNLPNPPVSTPRSANGPSRRVENVTYQSSRTTRHVKLAQGAIKRLSIAVLVDQTVQWEIKGNQMQRVLVPPAPEKLKSIHDLVATAVGLVPERGDQLTVETLPFDSTLNAAPPGPVTAAPKDKKPAPTSAFDQIKNNPLFFFGGIAVLTVALLVTVLLLRKKRARVELAREVPALPRASQEQDTVALSRAARDADQINREPQSLGQPLQLPPSRVEVLTGQLRDSVTRDSELWAGVVRSWLAEEEHA
jgi:flagellar M-ring protein FliF